MPKNPYEIAPQHLTSPTLPTNIGENVIFMAVPSLFLSRVDGAQNHFNEGGFFTRIVENGLTIDPESFHLEEVLKEDAEAMPNRKSRKIAEFKISPDNDTVEVLVDDGRKFNLRIRKYNITSIPYNGGEMHNLDSVRVFASTDDQDGLGAMLSFSLIKQQQ